MCKILVNWHVAIAGVKSCSLEQRQNIIENLSFRVFKFYVELKDVNHMNLFLKLKTTIICNKLYYIRDNQTSLE